MAERIFRIPTLLAHYFPCGHTHFHEVIKPRLDAAGGRVQLGERVVGYTETSIEIVQEEMKAGAEAAKRAALMGEPKQPQRRPARRA